MISETQLEILNSKETNYTNPVTSNVQNPSTYELASTKQVTSKSNEDSYLEVDFKDDEDDEYKTSAEGKKENTYTVSFQSSSLTSSDNDDDNNIDNDTNNTNVSNNTADEDDSINMKQFKQLLSKDEENTINSLNYSIKIMTVKYQPMKLKKLTIQKNQFRILQRMILKN